MKVKFTNYDYEPLQDLRGNTIYASEVTMALGMIEMDIIPTKGDLISMTVFIKDTYYAIDAEVERRIFYKDSSNQRWIIQLKDISLTPLEER